MLKKGASWLLLLSLLCSCFWILPASAEPASDDEAAAQGYQAKYTTADGMVVYAGFSEAVAAVPEGGTVTLLDNITVTGTNDADRLIVNRPITLDGNGKTVSGSTGSYLVRFDATGTMKNLTILQTGAAAAMQVNAGATATVEHSVIRCTATTPYGTVVLNGMLILDNGAQVISEGSAADGTQSVGVRMNTTDSELVVNEGASITTVGNSFKANITNTSVITINGGTITTSRHMWEAAGDNRCTLIINGGTFVSNHATDALICVFGSKDQTVRLLGGNFTAPKIIDTEGALAELGGTVVHNGEVIFNEPMADDIENPNVDIRLPNGNAATLGNSGIRFETRVEKAWLDAMTEAGVTVATGTLIAAKASVEAAGAFTAEALEAAGKNYLDIANEGWYNADAEDDFYQFYGTMVNLQESSLTGELAGIGYVTLTVPGLGSFTYYGDELTGTVRDLAADITAQDDAQTAVLNFFRGSAD